MTATKDRQAVKWPGFLTVAEVAVIMRVSKMTVYRLMTSGELRGKKFGRNYRVTEQSLADYLDVTEITAERETSDDQ